MFTADWFWIYEYILKERLLQKKTNSSNVMRFANRQPWDGAGITQLTLRYDYHQKYHHQALINHQSSWWDNYINDPSIGSANIIEIIKHSLGKGLIYEIRINFNKVVAAKSIEFGEITSERWWWNTFSTQLEVYVLEWSLLLCILKAFLVLE